MITVPSEDILDRFKATYFRKEDGWLFPSYRLGFVTLTTDNKSQKDIPIKCQESLIAFNNGYADALAYLNGRVEVEKLIEGTSVKSAIKQHSPLSVQPTKEYTPPF